MAIDHMPTSTSFLGKAGGTGRPVWSILSMVSMRVGSDPTTLATVRGRPGTVTKMSVGLPTKLNVLVMMYPAAAEHDLRALAAGPPDGLGPAGRLDPDDARGDPGGRLLHGLLGVVVDVLG